MNLKRLAAHLGLSQTTVSRALNGYPEVNERTRRRVLEAADEFNYRPNPSAMRLATGRSRSVGLVLPTDDSYMPNPHFTEFLAGVGQVCGSHGYDIVISPVEDENRLDAYARLTNSSGVDGMIISGPLLQDPRILHLQKLGLPFVVHGRDEQSPAGYTWLDVDNFDAFHKAAKLLIQLGHRNIAVINGKQAMTFADHRHNGFVAAMSAAGIPVHAPFIHYGDMTDHDGFDFADRLLNLNPPPTAIICASVVSAVGAMRAIKARGLTVGSDVSVIAFDDVLPVLKAESQSPPMTILRSSIRAAGKRVAEILITKINNKDTAIAGELWPVDLVVLETTGPPKTMSAT